MSSEPQIAAESEPPGTLTITRVVLALFLLALAAKLVLDGLTLGNLALHPEGLMEWVEESGGIPTRSARVLFALAVVGMDGILPFLTGAALLAAGIILIRKHPRGIAGLSLGLFLVAGWVGFLYNPTLFDLQWMARLWGVSLLPGTLYRIFTVTVWGWARESTWWYSLIIIVAPVSATVAATAFLQFSVSFPRTLTLSRRQTGRKNPDVGYFFRSTLPFSWKLWWIPAAVLVTLLATVIQWRMTGTMGWGFVASWGLAFLAVLAFFLAGVANVAHSTRTAAGEERRRVLWIAGGVLVFLLGAVLFLLVRFSWFQYADDFAIIPTHWSPFRQFLAVHNNHSLVATLAWIGTSAAFLYAIFGAGALDPGLAVKRSTVYGTLGAIFLVGFAVLESALEDFVRASLGLPGSVGSVMAAGVVALALIPFHKRLKRTADRLFPSEPLPTIASE
ncbi:hypothetical protein ACFL5A_04955 [Gemmatimonadota bacterium]